jgi:uncharacterized protein YuzE
MRIHFSKEADALYIRFRETPIIESDEITEDIIFDYDAEGKVVGIEILDATEKTDVGTLMVQAFGSVTVKPGEAA